MSYTRKDVDEAEDRIRREVPGVHISRTNYDWNLSVATPDMRQGFIVFACHEGGPTIVSDVDAVIRMIKS